MSSSALERVASRYTNDMNLLYMHSLLAKRIANAFVPNSVLLQPAAHPRVNTTALCDLSSFRQLHNKYVLFLEHSMK